jgi:hypothetical protein
MAEQVKKVSELTDTELERELQERNTLRDDLTAEIRFITAEQARRRTFAAVGEALSTMSEAQRATIKAML